MSRKKHKGRGIHGLLLVDKPAGRSSNQVLQDVKRIFDASKAGHTGTLDPIATGLLIVCFGHATKVSQHLLNSAKTYRVTCRLGAVTETADREGEVIQQMEVTPEHLARMPAVLEQWVGEQEQLPPMYSAVKINGTPLYKLARQGKTVERKPRQVTIYSITQIQLEDNDLVLDIHCSKGTYVRTLVEQIGASIGCGAYVHELRRLRVAQFALDTAYTIESLRNLAASGHRALDQALVPIEQALLDYPELRLSSALIEIARQGKRLRLDSPPGAEYLRVYDRNGIFCGLGEIGENGRMALRTFAAAGARQV